MPYCRLTLEVNAEPPNEASMAFHLGRGFVEVGTLGDDGKAVALLTEGAAVSEPLPGAPAHLTRMWEGDRFTASLGMEMVEVGTDAPTCG